MARSQLFATALSGTVEEATAFWESRQKSSHFGGMWSMFSEQANNPAKNPAILAGYWPMPAEQINEAVAVRHLNNEFNKQRENAAH